MPRVSSPVFVGRHVEVERLLTALQRAAAGEPTTHLIVGEAGIGKTRLVDEVVARARADGGMVLVGGALQLGDSGLPYAPFVAALRPLVRTLSPDQLDAAVGTGRDELAHLLPDLGHVAGSSGATSDAASSASAAQARLFEIVLGLLRRLAEDRPVTLVLEDLHWADSSSRDLLRFLVRNVRDERLMIMVTYRSDELHRRHPLLPLLAELQRSDRVDVLELGAFGHDELAEQVSAITGRDAEPALVDTVLTRSGGNPFFVEELLVGGEAGLVLPRTLRDTLDDRVRRLQPDAQVVVRVASVAGAHVDHHLLAAVVDLPEDRLTDALHEVVEHHLLVPSAPDDAPGYAFRHALVQEVVYEELLPSERTRLHAAYAAAMEDRSRHAPGDASAFSSSIAHHWLMAHDLERALPACLAAARAASASLAFPEAQAYLERALELWPKVPPASIPPGIDRITILEEAAEAAALAGDAHRSIDLAREALAELDPRVEPMRTGVLHHRLAWYLNESGDWQAGVAAFERAVALIPIDPPTRERARLLADVAHSLMVRSRFGDSLALGEAALATSRSVGARVAEARSLNVIGLDLACRSDFDRGIPILVEGHELAVELGDPQAIFLTAVALGWAYDESALHAEALELARRTHDRIRHLGAEARFGGQLASKEVRALFELGRWPEADALISATLDAGTTRYAVRWLLSNRLRLRAARGELAEAEAELATYEALGERVIGPDPDLMNARRAELAIAAGQPHLARQLMRTTIDLMAEPDLDTDARMMMLIGLRAEVAEADSARETGDDERLSTSVASAEELHDRLRRHAARVAETALRLPRIVTADVQLGAALWSRARGDTDVDAWEEAVKGRRALGRPHELATALTESAVIHLALRRREDGAAALAEAHGIAAELGATPLRMRLESMARRARIGLEGVDTADDAADRLGLTRREREVLALVADGRSNRQIGEQLYMAESTAGVHVSNILAKLGATRRSEAAAIAHRMGLLSAG